MSYGARLSLINSILSSIKSFLRQLCLLPKKLIREVEAVCRNFLWTGLERLSKKPLVAWEVVCAPYKTGGLNIKNFVQWNRFVVLKQLWAIDQEKEMLWLKWIHSYYTKGESALTTKILITTASMTKKMLQMRDLVDGGWAKFCSHGINILSKKHMMPCCLIWKL